MRHTLHEARLRAAALEDRLGVISSHLTGAVQEVSEMVEAHLEHGTNGEKSRKARGKSSNLDELRTVDTARIIAALLEMDGGGEKEDRRVLETRNEEVHKIIASLISKAADVAEKEKGERVVNDPIVRRKRDIAGQIDNEESAFENLEVKETDVVEDADQFLETT